MSSTAISPSVSPKLADAPTGLADSPIGGPIAFLSDFGLDDEFVGVVHAVLGRHAPGVPVVDVTHRIPAHDIRAGAWALWRSAPWLAPGVILAVVDPGVGSSRRRIAVEVAHAGAVLVGPDNGLLLPASILLGGITGAVELPAAADAPGATFDGRDVFAPAAAAAATGTALADLGEPLDPGSLQPLELPKPVVARDGRSLTTEVLWVDRFGNAQLALLPDEAPADPVVTTAAGVNFPAPVVRSYAAIPGGGYALVVDSYGLLAVCADRRAAAAELGLQAGDVVTVSTS